MVRTYYEVVVVAELQSRESRSWQESFHYPFVLVHHVIEAIFDLCPPNQDFAKSTVRSELFDLRPNDLILDLDLHESSLSKNSYILKLSPRMSLLFQLFSTRRLFNYLVLFIL